MCVDVRMEWSTHDVMVAVPEAGEVVDNGARVALLQAQHADVRGLVVGLLRRVLHQVFNAQQRSPTERQQR